MTPRIAGLSVAVLALVACTALADVHNPWVTTDRTVDCSSFDSIARAVLTKEMTDEEKAIALYHFFRQRVYHYQNLPESREPLKTVNLMGNTLCGSQACCMKGLLEGCAGLKTRVVSQPGHTYYEVHYDGKWHGFDTMTNFYVFTRGDKRSVASFEELNKDPSLIADAIKEGRAAQCLCPCGDEAIGFSTKIEVMNDGPATSKWSVKQCNLRQGEEIVRGWWPEGKPLPGSHRHVDPGPLHTCGAQDRKAEPFQFRFWEPYGIPNFGPNSISYRHYFNGQMNYSPDLTDKAVVLDGGATLEGVHASPRGLAGAGVYAFKVKSPFYATGAVLQLEVDCPGAGDAVAVEVDQAPGPWLKALQTTEVGKKTYRVELDKAVVRAGIGRYEYAVKIGIQGHASVGKMHLRTWFMHNAMAAPHLMPGKNVVTVEVANEESLKAAPLSLIYRYRDAPQWMGAVKTVESRVARNQERIEIVLPASEKLPQMRDMTLRYGTLSWQGN